MGEKVNLQCSLARPNMPVSTTQQIAYVLLEAVPSQALAEVEMPLNLSLVLDHSGSMSGEKLDNLKSAVRLVLDGMTPNDHVSLVVFDDKAKVVASTQPVTDPGHLKSLVDGISDGGGTKMSKGMKLGIDEIQRALDPMRVSRILLLTDGQTFGDEDTCRQLGGDAGDLGVGITALGLGDEWNEDLLDEIADASSGTSDWLDTPDEIRQHFQAALRSMQDTVAANAQLVLRLVSGVTPRQVWRVVPQISLLKPTALADRDVQVELDQLEKGRGQSVLVELLVSPKPEGQYRIAQAEVTYDIPATGVRGELVRADILASFTSDQNAIQQYDANVMCIVEKVTAFKLQTRALDEAAAGNVAGATQKLRAAATRLLELDEPELAAAYEEEAARLEQGQPMSDRGTKKLRYETRKLTQKLDD